MNIVYLVLGLGLAILLVGAIVIVLMSMGTRNRQRVAHELHTRHIARQPWDAHGRVR